MKIVRLKNVLATGLCFLMIMPPFGFSEDKTLLGGTTAKVYIPEVPALVQEDEPNAIDGHSLPVRFDNDSPISLPDNQASGTLEVNPSGDGRIAKSVLANVPPTDVSDNRSGEGKNIPSVANNDPHVNLPDANSGGISGTDPSQGEQNIQPIAENVSPVISRENSSDAILATLTEDEAAKVLVLLKDTLSIVGKDPRLSKADIAKYDKANTLIANYLSFDRKSMTLNESSNLMLDSESFVFNNIDLSSDFSKDTRYSALKTLNEIQKIFNDGLENIQVGEHPSVGQRGGLIQRFVNFLVAIIQQIRQHVEDGAMPGSQSFLLPVLESVQAQQGMRLNTEQLSERGQSPIQIQPRTLTEKSASGEETFFLMIDSVLLSRGYVNGNVLPDLLSHLYSLSRLLFYGPSLASNRAERYLAEPAKAKKNSLRSKAGEGLLRRQNQALEVIAPFDFSKDAISLPLTEGEARNGLYLLSEALVAAGNAPGLTPAEVERCERANRVIIDFLRIDSVLAGKGPSSALEALDKVEKILGKDSWIIGIMKNSSSKQPKELIQELASHIVRVIQSTRQRVKDESLPGARQFSMAESDPSAIRPTLLPGNSFSQTKGSFQVIDSVVLGRQNARTSALLDPPHNLHPFIRLLFYGRFLTPDRAEGYLAERAKVQEIFLRAKAGEGLIRYKGKIMERFLPLPGDENGGAFELVRRI